MKMGYESSWGVLEVKLSDTIDLESNLNVQPLAKKNGDKSIEQTANRRTSKYSLNLLAEALK